MNGRIYLDNAATTPVDEEVLKEMMPYFSEKFANPASMHQDGEEANAGVTEARDAAAKFLGCNADEIIFTSGATEGNNMAIKSFGQSKKLAEKYGGKIHIITSAIEHDCILRSTERLLKNGEIEATFIPVDSYGAVDVKSVIEAIKENTALVSIMYANNETGVIQPIKEIALGLKKANEGRGEKKIFFHTDAAQALNYLDCDVNSLGVDLMTVSGHKIYGPKGIGAIYIRKGTPIEPFMNGGDQEMRLRAGTHNVPGIVGLGAAIKAIPSHRADNERIKNLRDKLIDGILKGIENSALNGSRENRLPNNANIRFQGIEGEAILMMFDNEGISVSTGSACAAKNLAPSHVLIAMGIDHVGAHSSIRFSLGRHTTESDVDKVIAVMPGIAKKLRAVSGSFNKADFSDMEPEEEHHETENI